MQQLPVALTIAGSDSGGGAGIQADILTFAACGVYATSAITCLTAQNPDGVSGVHACPGAFVREQAERVAEFFPVGAVKSGMLLNADIIGAVADFLAAHPRIPYILDPVMVATSGARLLDESALTALRERLVPRAALVTPNLDEAAILLGRRPAGAPPEQTADAVALAQKLGVPVLLKGGHANTRVLTDVFATPSGDTLVLSGRRNPDIDTHGSGCTLAAAVAAHLAKGRSLVDAVADAHEYLQRAIATPVRVAEKNYIAHLPSASGVTHAAQEEYLSAEALRMQVRPAPVMEKHDPRTDVRTLMKQNVEYEKSLRPPPPPEPPFFQTALGRSLLRWIKLNVSIMLGAAALHIIGVDGPLWTMIQFVVVATCVVSLRWVGDKDSRN
jgi:hydroxymethylpyrimidine/phosphomethylpyrimidine kinase